MTDPHRPAFCGCGRPTHSPLTACQPDPGDQTPRTCAQAAITRVRALADQLDNLERVDTGGMWLTEWVAAKIRAAITGDGTATPDTGTCDASVLGLNGALVGPCILRHGHDGPVHQAADRTRWAPTTTRTQLIPVDQLADGHVLTDEEAAPVESCVCPPTQAGLELCPRCPRTAPEADHA